MVRRVGLFFAAVAGAGIHSSCLCTGGGISFLYAGTWGRPNYVFEAGSVLQRDEKVTIPEAFPRNMEKRTHVPGGPLWPEERFIPAGDQKRKGPDEFSPDPKSLNDAQDLELTVGKSFVLECHEAVMRVAVGDPEIAVVRPLNKEAILINARQTAGITNLIVWYAEDRTDVYNLIVTYDVLSIQKRLKQMVPEADVSLSTSFGMLLMAQGGASGAGAVGARGKSTYGMLIVDGRVDDQETMDRVLRVIQAFVARDNIKNLMRLRGPQQVQLEVKIAEVSRTDLKRFGLGWLSNRSASGNQVGLGVFESGTASGFLTGGETGDEATGLGYAMALASPFSNAFQVAVGIADKDFMSIISLLKGQGLARILARPTLVAMSGQEASFLVGGQFPVPTTDEDGETKVDYKSYGVTLTFIPTVIGRETVNLKVKTGVSDIDYSVGVSSGGVAVPGLTSREADTSLQLKDGQTFAIAGLLKETVGSTVDKVPFLGDIPFLGILFRHKEYTKKEMELVIIVTPRLVKAMNPEEVPRLPGESEDFNQGDVEFFFLDSLWKEKPSRPEEMPQFCGPIGFERRNGRPLDGR